MTGFQNIMEKRASQEAEMQVLVEKFLSSGKQVTFVKAGRKAIKTFSVSGSVANKGAKSVSLKNSGIYKR